MAIKIPIKGGKIRTSKLAKAMRVAKVPLEDVALMPTTIHIPPPPAYDDDDRTLRSEQQIARVELLMLKGIRNKTQLGALLEINDRRTLDRYVAAVYARWEMVGTTREFTRHRGEALQRLDLVESELWSRLQNLDQKVSSGTALQYLNTIVRCNIHRAEMHGLTPKMIAHIGSADPSTLDDVVRKVSQHTNLTKALGTLSELLEARVVEHEG